MWCRPLVIIQFSSGPPGSISCLGSDSPLQFSTALHRLTFLLLLAGLGPCPQLPCSFQSTSVGFRQMFPPALASGSDLAWVEWWPHLIVACCVHGCVFVDVGVRHIENQ